MWSEDAELLCVRKKGNKKGGGVSPCSSLSAQCSRWLSRVEGTAGPQGALGTPSALHRARSPPSQHSPNTQASAIKTSPNKHTPNTLTKCVCVCLCVKKGRGRSLRGGQGAGRHIVELWCDEVQPHFVLLPNNRCELTIELFNNYHCHFSKYLGLTTSK